MLLAKNYEDLCVQAVGQILEISQKAIGARGNFTIALSGGSTPKGVYALMAALPYRDQFAWKKIHFFLGDERWVPADNPKSNFKMITEALWSHIDVPAANLHFVKTDTPDVHASAFLYEQELIRCFALKPHEFPSFDLILLGLGQDGHTASLFPHHPALEEKEHLVVGLEANGVPEKRISLTLPVINHARAVLFLVSGADKAQVLKKLWNDQEKKNFPAGHVNPSGELLWLVDQPAAALIN